MQDGLLRYEATFMVIDTIEMLDIPRGEMLGGIYHMLNRGNMKMKVFDDMDDYEYFLELLGKGSKRKNVEIHAYCLMTNSKSTYLNYPDL